MRRMELMTAGGVTLAGLGALVGLAIGSGDRPKLTAPRAQPVEVRTEIIRKTVNVYRREHPHHAAGGSAASVVRSWHTRRRARRAVASPTRTRTSGIGGVAPALREAGRKHTLKRLERDVRLAPGRQLGLALP